MTKPIIRIHDQELDEVIDREMSDAEYEVYETNLQADQAQAQAEIQAQAQAAIAKTALLERLGITEEEAQLLLS